MRFALVIFRPEQATKKGWCVNGAEKIRRHDRGLNSLGRAGPGDGEICDVIAGGRRFRL